MVAIERLDVSDATAHGVVDAHPVGERIERVAAIVDEPRTGAGVVVVRLVGRYLLSPAIFDALAEARRPRPEAGASSHRRVSRSCWHASRYSLIASRDGASIAAPSWDFSKRR